MKKITSTVLACSFAFALGSHTLAADEGVNQVGNSEEINQNLEVKDINTIIEENREYLKQEDIDLILKVVELKEENPALSDEEIVELAFPNFQTFGVLSSAGKVWNNLTAQEKNLVAKYPADAVLVKAAQSRTDNLADRNYPNWKDGDKGNAYRHALWNAIMSRDIGKTNAELFASAHENHGYTDAQYKAEVWEGFNGLQHRAMDLHNNKMGRDCYNGGLDKLLTDASLSQRVQNAITAGKAKILK